SGRAHRIRPPAWDHLRERRTHARSYPHGRAHSERQRLWQGLVAPALCPARSFTPGERAPPRQRVNVNVSPSAPEAIRARKWAFRLTAVFVARSGSTRGLSGDSVTGPLSARPPLGWRSAAPARVRVAPPPVSRDHFLAAHLKVCHAAVPDDVMADIGDGAPGTLIISLACGQFEQDSCRDGGGNEDESHGGLHACYDPRKLNLAAADTVPQLPKLRCSGKPLERDDFSSNRHPTLAFWWSMIFFRKPVPTPDQVRGRLFRDHALDNSGSSTARPPDSFRHQHPETARQ